MLPALPDIGRYFNIATDNDRQMVVTGYLAGLAVELKASVANFKL